MATLNPFDLLGDDDTEDPTQLIAKIDPKKAAAAAAKPQQPNKAAQAGKMPTKPLPPSQAVKEARSDSARGGRGGGRGFARGGRGGGGYNRDSGNTDNSYGRRELSGGQGVIAEGDSGKNFERRGGYGGPRGGYREGRRGFSNGDAGEGDRERPRRVYERHSGTGRGNEIKREGAGRGNWGTQDDEIAPAVEEVVNEGDKNLNVEKPAGEEDAADGNKEAPAADAEEKEPETKEMTLEEYEKVLEEKRKALLALKTSAERKVDTKEFASMQQLANKKSNDDIFIKLGADKDRKKELAEKEERAKKAVSINEFLKPAEGESYGRGRGRGRGRGFGGGYSGGNDRKAPSIEDPGQFPTLGGK